MQPGVIISDFIKGTTEFSLNHNACIDVLQAMLLEFLNFLGCVCVNQKPFTHKIRMKALYNVARHFGHKDFQC